MKYYGGEAFAIMRIQLFSINVEQLTDSGQIDPEIDNDLLTRARAIIDMLR